MMPAMSLDERAIRVFVSSTFRDMQLERDELVKRVFPRLRRLCEQRGVAWSEVDLRWGVTDEQAAEGAVLPICLAEIERTRPYFIGLLGQRYGWVPEQIPPELADELGWLTDDLGRSVTELEILHGVLNNPAAGGHAFFYLRDPAWVEALPDDARSVFVESDTRGAERLEGLRRRVRESSFPVADYGSPEELGERVLADLTALAERLFPESEAPDPATRADAVHAVFGQARFGLHVPRPELEAALAERVADGRAPLLVSGEPGAGASSLVTTWAAQWAAAHADATVLVHHADADGEAADFRQLAARLVAALGGGDHSELAEQLADAGPGAVRAAIERACRAAGPALVVLDGLDRLADVDRAPDLRWLPPDLADTAVRVVVTGTGERIRDAFDHRGWPVLDVPELKPDERRAIAVGVLALGAKSLDPAHLEALVAAPRTGNARFLRTVLDELRQHGEHFTLRALIDRLTAAASVDDLLERVLARYEADFEGYRAGLVGDAMRALWAARHGLAEAELLDLLEPGPDHLPQRVWAPLHLAAEHGLVSRGGLIGFAHADLRRAVEDRYLPTPEARKAAHAMVAEYFVTQPLGPRQADELAWQQAEAGDLVGLRATLADLAWAELAYTRNPGDLRRLWGRLAVGGSGGLADVAPQMQLAYADVIADPAQYDAQDAPRSPRQLVWGVARLLADAGAGDAALALHRYLVEAARRHPEGSRDEPGGDSRLRAALVNLGAVQLQRGDLDAAAEAFAESAERSRARSDDALLAAALANLAVVRAGQQRAADAQALFTEADRLYRATGDEVDAQANLAGWAELHRRQGEFEQALELLREQERICRELADPVAIGRSLAGQAAVRADQGHSAEALALLDEYAGIARHEGDVRGLAEALLNAAVTRGQLGDGATGVAAALEAEQLARRLGEPGLLAKVLVARANLAGGAGDWIGAERLAREAELTAREADALGDVALALGIAGTARREQGDLAGARAAHTEEAAVAARLGDPLSVATAGANLGNVALAEQQFDTALRHYADAEVVLRERGTPPLLVPILANRAQVHHMHERWPAALADYADAAAIAERMGNLAAAKRWAEPAIQIAYQLGDTARAEQLWGVLATVARASGDQAGLQRAIGERALMLINRGAHAEAAPLLDEQEQICRAIGDPVGLAQCIGNRAIVLRYQGDLDGSLRCLDQQLQVATGSGNAQGALFATANRGEVLGLLGRIAEARAALTEARATAARYGLAPMVQQLDQMLAGLPG